MKYYIYATINNITEQIYIGQHQTENLDDGYKGSGLHLCRAIRKYGKENFDTFVLSEHNSWDEMNNQEKLWVDQEWVDQDNSYNLKPGGQDNREDFRHTNISRKKISESQTGDKSHWSWKKNHTIESKKMMSINSSGEKNGMYGRKHTKESIAKMKAKRAKVVYETRKCSYCDKVGTGPNMTRYHFDNCKENK